LEKVKSGSFFAKFSSAEPASSAPAALPWDRERKIPVKESEKSKKDRQKCQPFSKKQSDISSF